MLFFIIVGFGLNDFWPTVPFTHELGIVDFSGWLMIAVFWIYQEWYWMAVVADIFSLKCCCIYNSVICIKYIICNKQDVILRRGYILLRDRDILYGKCYFPHIFHIRIDMQSRPWYVHKFKIFDTIVIVALLKVPLHWNRYRQRRGKWGFCLMVLDIGNIFYSVTYFSDYWCNLSLEWMDSDFSWELSQGLLDYSKLTGMILRFDVFLNKNDYSIVLKSMHLNFKILKRWSMI